MAFGDPMTLMTRYNWDLDAYDNCDSLLFAGKFDGSEIVSGTDDPTGWTVGTITGGTTSIQLGARTSGTGTHILRYSTTAPGTGLIFEFGQTVSLYGNEHMEANGHARRPFTFRIWARNNGTGTMRIQLLVTPTDANDGASGDSAVTSTLTTLSSTWTLYSVSFTAGDFTTTAKLICSVEITSTVDGNPILEFDESELYTTYTFAVNAAMPDEPRLSVPQRTFQRGPSNALIRHRPASIAAAKHEYVLHFGLIGLTQYEALRSLWLLDCPMRWISNLPHLPTYLPVVMSSDFNLRMKSPNVNANNYFGTITLTEF